MLAAQRATLSASTLTPRPGQSGQIGEAASTGLWKRRRIGMEAQESRSPWALASTS